ncbi:glycosyltransferase family A protein [Roseovarius sp. C03]|uniref:glycosyltransferase family A protein n=1 Tax=Roseovarius sp. C03 TaxID=3449222 RepID=UPI003EDBA07F
MRPAPAKDTAIVIPARNEEKRIAHCLNALAEQCSARVVVIVVVNNSTDSTVARARDAALRLGLDLRVLQRRLEPHEGVGTARRIGCDHALQHVPALRYLLTTDADCIVAPNGSPETWRISRRPTRCAARSSRSRSRQISSMA